jgi:hypothetical protein
MSSIGIIQHELADGYGIRRVYVSDMSTIALFTASIASQLRVTQERFCNLNTDRIGSDKNHIYHRGDSGPTKGEGTALRKFSSQPQEDCFPAR